MAKKRAYWLIKSEPSTYSWADLVSDGKTRWDGVRNYTARNNLRAMNVGDFALYYHSGDGKEIVGVAAVKRAAYPDPTTKEDWSAVDVEPAFALKVPVGLDAIRKNKALAQMALLKLSRMSVTPVTADEFEAVLAAGKTKARK